MLVNPRSPKAANARAQRYLDDQEEILYGNLVPIFNVGIIKISNQNSIQAHNYMEPRVKEALVRRYSVIYRDAFRMVDASTRNQKAVLPIARGKPGTISNFMYEQLGFLIARAGLVSASVVRTLISQVHKIVMDG